MTRLALAALLLAGCAYTAPPLDCPAYGVGYDIEHRTCERPSAAPERSKRPPQARPDPAPDAPDLNPLPS